MAFIINNILWTIKYIPSSSSKLMRTDGSRTVGMTDGNLRTIYLDSNLRGAFLERVLCHELCHAICFSYNIYLPMETEELLADFISLYGKEIIYLLDQILNSYSEAETIQG